MGQTLYLHIGHGKTGSSYLQSCFAASHDDLRRQDIAYPMIETMRKAAGGVALTGNGALLRLAVNDKNAHWPSLGNVLFSRENMYMWLADEEFRPRFLAHLHQRGIDRLSVLLFIRDPVSHLISLYQQAVKRSAMPEASIASSPTIRPTRPARS